MEDFEQWELVEDLDTEAMDWMFGEETADWIGETTFTSGAHSEAAARALASFMPALIEGLHRDPAARTVIEDLSGTSLEAVAPDDTEAWPAIIGALATALPSIISAIPSVVNAVQSVTGGGPRVAPPQPPARPAPPPPPRQPPAPAQSRVRPRPGETLEDDEALDIEALWRDVEALAPDEADDWQEEDEAIGNGEEGMTATGDEDEFADD